MPVVMPNFKSDDSGDDTPKCVVCGATKVVHHGPKSNERGLSEAVVCPNRDRADHQKLAH